MSSSLIVDLLHLHPDDNVGCLPRSIAKVTILRFRGEV